MLNMKIETVYSDVSDDFGQKGTFFERAIKATKSQIPDNSTADFLVLVPDGVYHFWGKDQFNVQGQTFGRLTRKEVSAMQESENLFDECDVGY